MEAEVQPRSLIDELVSLITENGPAQPGFVEVDRRIWDWNPRTDHTNDLTLQRRGNFYRTPMTQDWSSAPRVLPSADFAGQVTFVKGFIVPAGYGGGRLANLAKDTTIPTPPALTYIGDPEFATDGLVLQTTAFSSPANRTFAAMQWRLGEVSDPSVPNYLQGTPYRYEIEEVWNSGDLTVFNSQITLPPRSSARAALIERGSSSKTPAGAGVTGAIRFSLPPVRAAQPDSRKASSSPS